MMPDQQTELEKTLTILKKVESSSTPPICFMCNMQRLSKNNMLSLIKMYFNPALFPKEI